MTYWPVGFFIFLAALWLLANSIKNYGSVLVWVAGGSYGLAAIVGFAINNPVDGMVIPVVITIVGGTILMLIGMAFYLFWKEVC